MGPKIVRQQKKILPIGSPKLLTSDTANVSIEHARQKTAAGRGRRLLAAGGGERRVVLGRVEGVEDDAVRVVGAGRGGTGAAAAPAAAAAALQEREARQLGLREATLAVHGVFALVVRLALTSSFFKRK